MKILINLSAIEAEAEFKDPRASLSVVHHEPVRGFICTAALGSAGLVFARGKHKIAIPLAELWQLAARHAPELAPAVPQASPPASPVGLPPAIHPS